MTAITWTRRTPRKILLYIIAVVGALLLLYPLLVMLSNSLKTNIFVIEYPPKLIPENPSLLNYTEAWFSYNFQRYFTNSAYIALVSTVGTVFFAAMTAYAFARFNFRGKEILFGMLLLILMIPDMITIIPRFYLARSLNLYDSQWGLILFYIAGSISGQTFFLRGFFESLPRELEEAMMIDGASPFKIFLRLALPLAAPALATVAIFSFLANWEEYTWALTIIKDPLKRTLPIAIYSFQGQHATEWGLVFAAMIMALIPVIIIFCSLQRYFHGGLTAGAIK